MALQSPTVLGAEGTGHPLYKCAIYCLFLVSTSRTKIVNNTLPKVSLRSLPGFGHQVGFNTQLLVESTGYGMSIRDMVWGRRGGHHRFGK